MDFKTTILTKVLEEDNYREQLTSIVNILDNHGFATAEILFGVAWGNEYRDWVPFNVAVSAIESEIAKAEDLKVGKLGDDDFYVTLGSEELEILFCHERDVHLSFNQNSKLVEDILNSWREKGLLPRGK